MAADSEKNKINALNEFFKLVRLFSEDKSNLYIFLLYTLLVGLLYIAVPLAAQLMFNIISAGILIQPLVILTLVLFVGLVFLGVLRYLQIFIAELLQRKVFARISIRIAEQLPRSKQSLLQEAYAPELANRFFDIITIQKALSLLLLEVPSAVLQILLGIVLISFYSTYLLVFDLALIASVVLLISLGYKSISTNYKESSEKYKLAYWLEEIARCQVSMKMNLMPDFIFEKTLKKISSYIGYREDHFRVLSRQYIASFAIEAFASCGVLLIGGWLVINQQLTLGQLIAAELVILMIISALDKIVQKFATYYDLIIAVNKTTYITELESERSDGSPIKDNANGADIECQNLNFGYYSDNLIFKNLNLSIKSGDKISLVGHSGVGKSTLAYLLCGLYEPDEGKIFFNQQNISTLNLNNLRSQIALVSDFYEVFEGTVRENICFGRDLKDSDLERVITMTCLDRDLKMLNNGLDTHLISEGKNISLGQRQRILIARAIINSPKLLILDEAFAGMDEKTKLFIIERLFDKSNNWTILNISHDANVVERSEKIFVLADGKIQESGNLKELSTNVDSAFCKLFPELSKLVRG